MKNLLSSTISLFLDCTSVFIYVGQNASLVAGPTLSRLVCRVFLITLIRLVYLHWMLTDFSSPHKLKTSTYACSNRCRSRISYAKASAYYFQMKELFLFRLTALSDVLKDFKNKSKWFSKLQLYLIFQAKDCMTNIWHRATQSLFFFLFNKLEIN